MPEGFNSLYRRRCKTDDSLDPSCLDLSKGVFNNNVHSKLEFRLVWLANMLIKHEIPNWNVDLIRTAKIE